MAHPFHHAESSARKYGGKPEDYLAIHQWFDESKAFLADFRHRALRHHAEGIFLAEKIFGITITNSTGRIVPVRWIGEQHVKEDMGFIPSVSDWLKQVRPSAWMCPPVALGARELQNIQMRKDSHENEELQNPFSASAEWHA